MLDSFNETLLLKPGPDYTYNMQFIIFMKTEKMECINKILKMYNLTIGQICTLSQAVMDGNT